MEADKDAGDDNKSQNDTADPPDEPEPAPDLATLSQEIDQFITPTSQSQPPPEILQQFADLFDVLLAEYESDSKKWIHDSSSLLESLHRTLSLLNSLSRFSSEEIYAAAINRLSGILQRAMSFMELEFKAILDDYKTSYDRHHHHQKQLSSSSSNVQEADQPELPESESKPDEDDDFQGYSDDMVSNLNKLAEAMVSSGHETECCELYFFVRRNAMEKSLKKLGFGKFCFDEVQKMQWEALEREVVTWMKTFKDFATSLLPSERRLAEAVFSDTTISESLFSSLARGIMFNLVNFAEAVSMTKRSAEKLFKFLDVYETLRDTIEELECLNNLRSEAKSTRNRLGDAIFSIFGELETSIKADPAKTPVPGGAVHPLTRYTMNYLRYACEYKETLEQVFRDHIIKKIDSDSSKGSDFDANDAKQQVGGNQSPFQVQLLKVMELLDANLEAKSKLYKDPSLSLIFLMNNGRYILQKIKAGGELSSLMGESWVRKRSSDIRTYHTNYKRETWTKLLQCLNHEGLVVNGKALKPVLKERFKSFNAMFDEIHKTQSTWVVSDEQLQSELRVSISAIIIPAYRSFMGRFSSTFTPGRQTEKYIKYQPEDIETCIEDLFEGVMASQQSRRR